MHFPRKCILGFFALFTGGLQAHTPAALKPYISEDAPVLVLDHVRVIDGSRAVPAEDQRIEIAGGKIVRVEGARLRTAYPAGAKIVNLTARRSFPGSSACTDTSSIRRRSARATGCP